jgi:putative flippase GtrA
MLIRYLSTHIPERYKKIVRFLISGGVAFTVHFAILIPLVEIGKLHPVLASVVAFVFAFGVSFTLQKFWTFKDPSITEAPMQVTRYFGIALMNLGLTALLMYVFVERSRIYYILAQIMTTGLIAIESYFLYKYLVFTKPVPSQNKQ